MTFPWPEGCTLAPKEPPTRGFCVGCGEPLPTRPDGTVHPLRRWCGNECSGVYGRNHWWNTARFVAIQRASVFEPMSEERRAKGYQWELTIWTICDECRRETTSPEVNHVDPRNGQGYGTGCWNHQTNLQVLCHDCHVAETNSQRGARSATGASPMAIDWAAA